MPAFPTSCPNRVDTDRPAVASEVAEQLAAVRSDMLSASGRLEALLGDRDDAPPLKEQLIIGLVRVYERLEECLAEVGSSSPLDRSDRHNG